MPAEWGQLLSMSSWLHYHILRQSNAIRPNGMDDLLNIEHNLNIQMKSTCSPVVINKLL